MTKVANTTLPTVALFPAHPAQLWLMNALALELKGEVKIVWVLRNKDVLLTIANKLELEYEVISNAKTGLLGNFLELLANIVRSIIISRKHQVDLWFTKYGAGNIAAALCKAKSLSFNDDDIDVVPFIAITSYPFANKVIAPEWVRMGRYRKKTIRYRGSHEFGYLSSQRFLPDRGHLRKLGLGKKEPYIMIRMSALEAHHDVGISGLSEDFIDEIIIELGTRYKIFISSEKPLSQKYEAYQLHSDVVDIHHILFHADCLIADSLSMPLEAAVLGTPSIRLSDFGSQVSAFAAIEPFGLIFNFSPIEIDKALSKLREVLELKKEGTFTQKRQQLLDYMEDPILVFKNAILEQLSSTVTDNPQYSDH